MNKSDIKSAFVRVFGPDELYFALVFARSSIMKNEMLKSILQVSSLLLCILNGSFGIGKGFGFQKEHDGSLIGLKDSIQQIHLAGVYTYD